VKKERGPFMTVHQSNSPGILAVRQAARVKSEVFLEAAMLRTLIILTSLTFLAGCISFSSSESPAAPDYIAACQDKEAQCRQICADAGVQSFSCRAAPREGMDYKCECKKSVGKPL
jgi:hypothetical protein